VGVEFKVPFLTIPVKRSIDTMMNGGQQAFANVNFGSLLLALVFTAAGATLGGFLRATDDSSGHSNGLFFSPSKKGKVQDTFWDVFETLEKALLKYDIDATACTQRAICTYVKNSKLNVADGKASKSEIVVNGLANADWAMQMLSGNAIKDAIKVGKLEKSCEHVYFNCKLSPKFIDSIVKKIQLDNKPEV
jgi:DM4/DM12 family